MLHLYKDFIKESELMIQNNLQPGQYYVLYIDIEEISTVSHNYGSQESGLILYEIEKLLQNNADIFLCRRISADLILCLCFLEEDKQPEEVVKHCDGQLQAFLGKQRTKYPDHRLEAVCGIRRFENSNLLQTLDEVKAARKRSIEHPAASHMEEQPLNSFIHHGNLLAHTKIYLLVIVLCAVFLGACITGVLTNSRKQTQKEFTAMVLETLNAYTDGQRENTLKEIDGITSTLQSLAVLIRKNDKPDFINAYLQTLNEDSSDVEYIYSTEAEYRELHLEGRRLERDISVIERMKKGETVITDITYSERLGNIYCIGIEVPVIKDDVFIGMVRGLINAATLVKTELYDPAQGEVAAVFLTDSDGTILPAKTTDGQAVGQRLLERLEEYGTEEQTLRTLEAAFQLEDAKAESVRIGTFEGYPYYLSVTGLKYNDWHLVVCLKADHALEHFQYIVHSTAYSIIGLLAAVLIASAVLIVLGKKMQQKFSMDERRYLLLERFSDTVLFDYDYRHDTIRFTSNVTRFLRVHELVQASFLKHLEQVYIHEGDQEKVRRMLEGREEENSGEIKVRLMRPERNVYFWCQAQYQYLYEKGALVSVIGKITDIDEQMRHEDFLLRKSETDGLTGLLNKAAVETAVSCRLEHAQSGMLFIMDVDDFKEVNDKYGHDAGDQVLQFLGMCLQRTFSGKDILGRIGGDELLVYSDGIDNKEAAEKKAELLNQYLAGCEEDGIHSFCISIGWAQYPEDGNCFQELFRVADQSMYAMKKKGKREFSEEGYGHESKGR